MLRRLPTFLRSGFWDLLRAVVRPTGTLKGEGRQRRGEEVGGAAALY